MFDVYIMGTLEVLLQPMGTGKSGGGTGRRTRTVSSHPSSKSHDLPWLPKPKCKVKFGTSEESQLTSSILQHVDRKHLITQLPTIPHQWNQQFRTGPAHSTAGVPSPVCHKTFWCVFTQKGCAVQKMSAGNRGLQNIISVINMGTNQARV